MKAKSLTFVLSMVFVFSIAFGSAKDVLAASFTVETTSGNVWGPFNGTASGLFQVDSDGEYMVSGLPEGAKVLLYFSTMMQTSYPIQIDRNFVGVIRNGSVVKLEKSYYFQGPVGEVKKRYFFQDPDKFQGKKANIEFCEVR